MLTFSACVDGRVEVHIKGADFWTVIISGKELGEDDDCDGFPTEIDLVSPLPAAQTTVTLEKIQGRGDLVISQFPAAENDWELVVFINDYQRDVSTYQFNVKWDAIEPEVPFNPFAGQPSPLRYVPGHIKTVKAGGTGALTWVLALQLRNGVWMGFSAWDEPFDGIEITDKVGNTLPALTYNPAGASITNQNLELKLGSRTTDVKFLAPRYDAYVQMGAPDTLYVDREMLEAGEFENAFWILGEMDPEYPAGGMLQWNCGHVGNIEWGDLEATAELSTYDEIANRETGLKLHIFCQVGAHRLPNGLPEDFGTGRCENQVLHDGPIRADWTVEATIAPGSTQTVINVAYNKTLAISGEALHADFENRLANGDLEFHTTGDGGGKNAGHKIKISSSETLSTVGNIVTVACSLKLSSVFLVEDGDTLRLVAGCRRRKTDCIMYDNLANGRFQELPGNADLARRTRQ